MPLMSTYGDDGHGLAGVEAPSPPRMVGIYMYVCMYICFRACRVVRDVLHAIRRVTEDVSEDVHALYFFQLLTRVNKR